MSESPRLSSLTPEQRARLDARLAAAPSDTSELPRRTGTGAAPLSFAQRRLWFLGQLAPGLATYNMPVALSLVGPLDSRALGRALGEVLRRHEALRATIRVVDDEPMQVIAPAEQEYPLEVVDMAQPGAGTVAERLREEAARPFSLAGDRLFRARLFRSSAQEHVLALTAHHIVFDGWSSGILRTELLAAYEAFAGGRSPALPELSLQYADFSTFERQAPGGPKLDESLAYWKEQLAGSPPLFKLATDRPRPRVLTYRGATRSRALGPAVLEQARALSRETGSTTFTTLLATFVCLLRRYSGSDDIVVGSPFANRNRLAIEPLIGLFVNSVVLRTDASGNPTFLELLARVRELVADAHAHQDAPFDRVVEQQNPERNPSYSPLFQLMFQFDEAAPEPQTLGDLRVHAEWVATGTAKFDLSLQLAETTEGLRATIEYSTDLFDQSSIDRMLEHFEILLGAAVREPSRCIAQLPLMSEAERQRVLVEWNATSHDFARERACHTRVAECARQAPGSIAVVFGDASLSYAELDQRANQLAHHIIRLGAERRPVALALEPSLEMAVAVLGVLKAGGACVPLDATHPRERLSLVMGETGAPLLIAMDRLAGRVPAYDASVIRIDREWSAIAEEPSDAPALNAAPEDLAYVIYTSGSTGRPKGACLPHRTLTNLVDWHVRTFPRSPRALQFAPLVFDVSFYEMFTTWCAGGTLILGEPGLRMDVELLGAAIARHRVDKVVLPVVVLNQLAARYADDPGDLSTLRDVISTGEQLRVTPELERLFTRLGECRAHNHYGPSETHVVTAFTLPKLPREWPVLPPIGRPIANTAIYVLDETQEPVPIGVPGELWVGGDPVGLGYLERPELTLERFQAGRHGRLYRTGDLARWRDDSQLEFLGRLDHQVKLRGARVELGEIEAVLSESPRVREAVVLLREDVPGDQRLVAYVVLSDETFRDTAELRSHVARTMPAHMVPAAFVFLPALPITPRGKIERSALPRPSRELDDSRYVPPRDPIEARAAEIWGELLGLERIGVTDSFFEAGGHSLLATQIIARMSRAFGVHLMVHRLFDLPTIGEMAEEVRRLMGGAPGSPKIRRRADLRAHPLSHNQERALAAHRSAPDSPEIVTAAYLLEGPLDVAALERASLELMRRHEVLRARFEFDGSRFVQRIGPVESPLRLVDLGEGPSSVEARVSQITQDAAREPCDIRSGPVFRMRLVRVEPTRHYLVVLAHHAVWDGESSKVVVSEIMRLLEAERTGQLLPPLPFQYADFAAWQRDFYASPEGEAQIVWWTQHLEGALAPPLPTDLPREPVDARRREVANYPFPRGAAYLPVVPGLFERVQERARQHGTTPYEVLLTAFVAWIHRHCELDDFTLCTQQQNRHLEGTAELVGPFAQAFALRVSTAGDPTFTLLLERMHRELLDVRAHADVCGPFMQLSRFRLNFNYHPHMGPADVQTTCPQAWDPGYTIWYDVTFHSTLTAGELDMLLWYNRALWTPATAERWVAEYGALLQRVLANPDLRLSQLRLEGETAQQRS